MEHAVTVNCATRRYFHLLVLLVLLAATCQVAQVGVILPLHVLLRWPKMGTAPSYLTTLYRSLRVRIMLGTWEDVVKIRPFDSHTSKLSPV